MIRFEQVTKAYGEKQVVKEVSLTFDKGFYLLTGPSGIGKTTLLRLAAGLEQPDSGRIETEAGKRLRMVFQEDRLLPWKTVLGNVMLECGNKEKADVLLQTLGLSGEENAYPASLSGGMRRRTAISRALCAEPDILLLDEPFNGLDEAMKETAAALITEEMKGGLILCAAHETEVFAAWHPTILKLQEAKIIA